MRESFHPCIHLQFVKMLKKTLEPHGIFNQIIHHSAGNYQFAIHTYLLTLDANHVSCTFRSVSTQRRLMSVEASAKSCQRLCCPRDVSWSTKETNV